MGAQMSMAQGVCAVVFAATSSSETGDEIRVVVIFGLLGAIFYWASLSTLHRRLKMRGTSTSPCRSVCFGRTEVEGTTAPIGRPLRTPIGDREAVWYEWDLQQYRSSGRSGRWVTVEKRATAAPFWIEDRSGRILVRPRGAEIVTKDNVGGRIGKKMHPAQTRRELRELVLAGEDVIERERSLAQTDLLTGVPPARGLFQKDIGEDPPLRDLGKGFQIRERAILVGSPAYVLGEPSERTDGPGYEFDGSRAEVYISGRSELDQRREYHRGAIVTAALALGLSAFASAAFGSWQTDRFQPSWISVVAGVQLAAIVGLWGYHLIRRRQEPLRRVRSLWPVVERSLAMRAAVLAELSRNDPTGRGSPRYAPMPATPTHQAATSPSEAAVAAARALDHDQRRAVAAYQANVASRPEADAGPHGPDLLARLHAAAVTIDAAMHAFDAAARRCTGPADTSPMPRFQLGDVPRPTDADRPPELAPPFSIDDYRGRRGSRRP